MFAYKMNKKLEQHVNLGLICFGLIRPFQASFPVEKLSSLKSIPELYVSTRNKNKNGLVRSFSLLYGSVKIRVPYHLDQILDWIEWSIIFWSGTVFGWKPSTATERRRHILGRYGHHGDTVGDGN
jgi:hypothetical protein